MAKNNVPKKSAPANGATQNALSRTIERLDKEIIKLANERARDAGKLARLLKEEGKHAYDVVREQELLRLASDSNKGPLSESSVRALLRELNSGCRATVLPIRVAYLGPQYSYSHQAAVENFGTSAELSPVSTIAAVFEELNRGHADFGLVPIENSTDGRIVDTLDMFARHPIRISGEIHLQIHHNLLARCPRVEIQEVYSKPQALSQCRDWLAKHLPGVRLVEMTSTAAAAQLAADRPGAAAIAGVQAGVNYGLEMIAASIEDNKNNITRFAVIGGECPRRTGNDKTALMFELHHRSGALADAVVIFKKFGLNLTWIESFPMTGTKNEYLFFVEFEGYQNDPKARRAIETLKKRTVRLDVLGSYPRGKLVE